MRAIYTSRIEEAEQAIRQLSISRDEAASNASQESNWVSQFVKFQGIDSLTREVVFTLVDKVYVHADQHIKIDFNYRDEIAFYSDILHRKEKEVV